MSLIDKLRGAAEKLPPSQVPSLNELAGTVGAVLAYIEHGDSFLSAAEHGAEKVAELFAPAAETVAEDLVPGSKPVIDLGVSAIETAIHDAEQTKPAAPVAPAPVEPVTPAPEAPAAPVSSDLESLQQQAADAAKQLEAIQTAIAAAQRGEATTTEQAAS